MNGRLTGPLTLSLIILLVALFAFAPRNAWAASENVIVTITMSPAGSASQTVLVSGCSASVGSVTANGVAQPAFTASQNCVLTFTAPTESAQTVWDFSVGGVASTTWTFMTGASGTDTPSNTLYNEDRVTASYSVSGGGSGYSAPTLTYQRLGTSGLSYTMTGAGTEVDMDHGTAWAATNPLTGSGATQRWEAQTSSGISGPGETIALAYLDQLKLQVSYAVAGGGSGYASPIFTCLQFGSAFTYVATPVPTGVWVDAGCSYTFTNPLGGSGSSERWEAGGGTSGFIASASSPSPTYYNQFLLSLSYSVTGGGSPTAPSLVSYQFGSSFTTPLTTTVQGYWADSGASWTVTNPTPGSTSSERWETPGVTSGTSAAGAAISLQYFHQYGVSFSYSVNGGGSGYSAPALTYSSLGGSLQATLSTTASQYWIDVGSTWNVSGQLGGSSATERWSARFPSGAIATPSPVTLAYYHQYSFTASYTVAGGGAGYAPPSFACTSYGSSASTAVSPIPSPIWVDAGSQWTTDNPLSGSSAQERWDTNSSTSGTVTAPVTSVFDYFHQFFVAFGFTVVGGGTGYSQPSVTTVQFGGPLSGLGGWADAGSKYNYTNPLVGSSPTERWYTGSALGTIQSSSSINATYYHQFDFALAYEVVGPGTTYSPPSLNSSSLKLPLRETLQTAPGDYWLDSGAAWAVTNPLPGSGPNERWMTSQGTSGTVKTHAAVSFEYFDQYAGFLSYAISGGGAPRPPTLNYTAFSSSASGVVTTSQALYWLDSRSGWSLTNPLNGTSPGERWIASKGASGTAANAFNDTVVYARQYYLSVRTNAPAGGAIQNASNWYNIGSSARLNASAASGWKFTGWNGTGGGSYSGSDVSATLAINSAVNETAVFYAGLALTSGPGGAVRYQFGAQTGVVAGGSNATLYVLPGTTVNLNATSSSVLYVFKGWSGDARGTTGVVSLKVNSPMSATSAFGLDYTNIGVFDVSAIIVIVLTIYVLVVRRRHDVFGSARAPPARFLNGFGPFV